MRRLKRDMTYVLHSQLRTEGERKTVMEARKQFRRELNSVQRKWVTANKVDILLPQDIQTYYDVSRRSSTDSDEQNQLA